MDVGEHFAERLRAVGGHHRSLHCLFAPLLGCRVLGRHPESQGRIRRAGGPNTQKVHQGLGFRVWGLGLVRAPNSGPVRACVPA